MVEIFNGPLFLINTTKLLQIYGTIGGHPDPSITLSKTEDGLEVEVPADHPRIAVSLVNTKLKIVVISVYIEDGGTYLIKAKNEVGENQAVFVIETEGKNLVY